MRCFLMPRLRGPRDWDSEGPDSEGPDGFAISINVPDGDHPTVYRRQELRKAFQRRHEYKTRKAATGGLG